MRIIETKYFAPTVNKSGRIRARLNISGRELILAYDYSLTDVENHKHVAAELARSAGISGNFTFGNTSVYEYTFLLNAAENVLRVF